MALRVIDYVCTECGWGFEEIVDTKVLEETLECPQPDCKGKAKRVEGILCRNPKHLSWSSWQAGND